MSLVGNTSSLTAPTAETQTQAQRRYQKGRSYLRMSMLLTYLILGIGSVIILLPFAWLLSASLKTLQQYFASPVQWIPHPFVWSNYVEAFTTYNFATYVGNSLFLAI